MTPLSPVRQAVLDAKSDPLLRQHALQLLCRDVVARTGATRASLWVFTQDLQAIRCLCLYDAWHDGYSADTTLTRQQYAPYFDAIVQDHQVVAPRARTHPATSCFNQTYFDALDIHSLLDFVVLTNGQPTAVLCCENCGEPRNWTDADMAVLRDHSDLVSHLL